AVRGAAEADPGCDRRRASRLLAATTTLGLHSLVFIYFLGTGRWVKEVTLAYGMPDEPLHKETRELKRKVFPPALFSMLVLVPAVATGAGVQTAGWPWWTHMLGAIAAIGVNLWAFPVELRCVTRNARIIDDVMREVDRIRAEKGLPTNAEALRQQQEQAAGGGG
ncbi:MAG: hypothetical protein K2W96_11400, partial [Gemmataceae bacterium]|nr:hypothetical protein [Gemmataceae bacterium]